MITARDVRGARSRVRIARERLAASSKRRGAFEAKLFDACLALVEASRARGHDFFHEPYRRAWKAVERRTYMVKAEIAVEAERVVALESAEAVLAMFAGALADGRGRS